MVWYICLPTQGLGREDEHCANSAVEFEVFALARQSIAQRMSSLVRWKLSLSDSEMYSLR